VRTAPFAAGPRGNTGRKPVPPASGLAVAGRARSARRRRWPVVSTRGRPDHRRADGTRRRPPRRLRRRHRRRDLHLPAARRHLRHRHPDSTVRETRDRVYAAVRGSGQTWPAQTITVSLLPTSLPKRGTSFDLAIAVAALTAAGAVPAAAPERCVFYSELGLDGSLRPVRAVVRVLLAAAQADCIRAVVAAHNSAEAVMVPGLAVAGWQPSRAVLAWLNGERLPVQSAISAATTAPPSGICATLTYLVEPAHPLLGSLLRVLPRPSYSP
jgi:hypothetical protein